MSEVTARPEQLRRYRDVARDVTTDLRSHTSQLGTALDTFRATPDWYDHVSDVPPLDVDLSVVTETVRRLGAYCGRVAAAFGALDEDGLGTASAADVARRAGSVHPDGVDLFFDGERWIVNGTDQPDHVRLTVDEDGRYVLVVGTLDPATGRITYHDEVVLTDHQAANLTIRTGGGNDVVEVHPDVRISLRIWTGDGDDVVGWTDGTGVPRVGGGGDLEVFLGDGDDIAFGGAGDDRIYGGAGRDTIDGGDGDDLLVGGDGNDTLYGGRGDDVLHGGAGDDYLDGGSGNDRLDGGAGDDVLSGGRGDDVLYGGDGDDVLIGGRGADRVDGGRGDNTVYTSGDDRIRNAADTVIVEVTGEPGRTAISTPQPDWMSDEAYHAWLERIDADLETLTHLPSGNEGLRALDDAHDRSAGSTFDFLPWVDGSGTHVVILPYGSQSGAESHSIEALMNGGRLPGSYAGPPGYGGHDDAVVNYGTLHPEALDERPPLASLYHELSHSFDQISGGTRSGDYTEVLVDEDGNELRRNSSPMAEINAVGFDLDGDGSIDTQTSGDGSHHPEGLTENALRDDLGRPRRPSYTIPPDDIPEGGRIEVEDVDP